MVECRLGKKEWERFFLIQLFIQNLYKYSCSLFLNPWFLRDDTLSWVSFPNSSKKVERT